MTPFLHKLGPKMVIFRSFNNLILNESPNIFQCKPAKKQSSCSRGKNFLGQIRSNVVKKVKKVALSIDFFHILHVEYLLKQKVVVVPTP